MTENKIAQEFKKCPFCGGIAKEEEAEFCTRIVCQSCYAEARTADIWNQRKSELFSNITLLETMKKELDKAGEVCCFSSENIQGIIDKLKAGR